MGARDLDEETRALMTLSLVPGIGGTLTMKLLAHFGSAAACLDASEGSLQSAGLTPRLIASLLATAEDGLDPDEERLLMADDVSWIRIGEASYPPLLEQIYDPPPMLFVRGTLTDEDHYAVAIVGSRRARPAAQTRARELAQGLAEAGVTVVSGLALGVDTAAHEGALEAGGRTVAVMGCGLSHVYPPGNEGLARRTAEAGALVSEFPMSVPPIAQNVPRRNRIMSGICLATIVVEAPSGSGALITADLALEQGRDLFVVPWEDGGFAAAGSNGLIDDGAKPVTTAGDVIAELKSAPRPMGVRGRSPLRRAVPERSRRDGADPAPQPAAKAPDPALQGDEARVWDVLTREPTHIDAVVHLTGISAAGVGSALLLLEMKSLVRQFPGKRFARGADARTETGS